MNGERHEDDLLAELESVAVSDEAGEARVVLLHNLVFRLGRGEWVFVTGPNGSGKSTLVRLLAGHGGELTVKGRIARGFAGSDSLPYVMQHPDAGFVGETPWEDVIMGLEQAGARPDIALSRAGDALAGAGMGELKHRPLGGLSGGQKQRAAAAACMAVMPDLLILDEADAMLDPQSRRRLLAAARSLWRRGAAVLWVSQRLEDLEEGDRLVAIHNGRLVYDGDAEGFYLKDAQGGASVCASLGYAPPYAVQVALELRELGVALSPLPLTPDRLARAVSLYG